MSTGFRTEAKVEHPQRSDVSKRALLVAGGPRMGTSWVARTLRYAQGAVLISEPDNEWPNPFALKAKISLGRFPVLLAGDRAPREYEELWARALAGYDLSTLHRFAARRLFKAMPAGPRLTPRDPKTDAHLWRALCDHANPWVSPRLRFVTAFPWRPSRKELADVVLVKSVYAPLALEWIVSRLHPRVLLVLRHPLNVVASWGDLGWGGCALETNPRVREAFGGRFGLPELPAGSTALARVAWEVGLFTSVLEALVDEHLDWFSISHEELCVDPIARFKDLYARVGLTWTYDSEGFLRTSNRAGIGFEVQRVASEQPNRWRKRLTSEQLQEIWAVFSRFRAPWVERVGAELE